MISLSNYSKKSNLPKKKVIGIKSLDVIKENDEKSNDTTLLSQQAIILRSEIEALRSELTSLKHEKNRMLTEAIEEIKSEKDNWSEERANLIKQANEEGYQAGFAEGESQSIDQYSEILAKANEIMDKATMDYHKTLEESDEVIIKIAIYVAEKIIKDQISKDSNVFKNVVESAINEIKDQSIVSIYLHPNNYEFILTQKKELRNSLDGDAKIAIYADHKMTENACLIKHPFGQIDASIDTQLKQIRSALDSLLMENE